MEFATHRLAAVFATALGRPVVNHTGLTGAYDLSLQWDDAPVRDGGFPGTACSVNGHSFQLFSVMMPEL